MKITHCMFFILQSSKTGVIHCSYYGWLEGKYSISVPKIRNVNFIFNFLLGKKTRNFYFFSRKIEKGKGRDTCLYRLRTTEACGMWESQLQIRSRVGTTGCSEAGLSFSLPDTSCMKSFDSAYGFYIFWGKEPRTEPKFHKTLKTWLSSAQFVQS